MGAAILGAVLFVLALLWKIVRSEEGFLFGYGNWVVGKWQKGRPATPGEAVPAPAPQPEPRRFPTANAPGEEALQALRAELVLKTGVLSLSKALDADMAAMMLQEADAWPEKLWRALQTLVSGVTRVVQPAASCRAGFFALDEDEAHLVLWVGEGYQYGRRPRLAIENSCAGRAFITGVNYYCKNIKTDPVYFHSTTGSEKYLAIACVPIQTSGQIFGVLCVDAEQADAFSPPDFEHLEVFAAKLAVFLAFHSLHAGSKSG
jgi:putative methionine-R-sulfoxide reductase with GAF domain